MSRYSGRRIRRQSFHLDYFQEWVLEQFRTSGYRTGTFEVAGKELQEQPAFLKTYQDIKPDEHGPKNVYTHLNPEADDGVLFFAHADKSPISFEYARKYPRLLESADRFSGPGIADDVAGIAAMISALKMYKSLNSEPLQQILLASVLGKQGGVFGSYGLMKRFAPLSSAVYLHPAESGGGLAELKIASNGLIEFVLTVQGTPPDSTEVHQTIFSRSAVSAFDKTILVYRQLQQWAEDQSQRYRHEAVEAMAGQSFAVSMGIVKTGAETEVFEIPLSCRMAGILCFPPQARLAVVREQFETELSRIAAADPWLADNHWRLEYGDRIAESSETQQGSAFVKLSSDIVASCTGVHPAFFYGHSMSDIRYPQQYWKAQAYGIGPRSGDLGKESEWVDKKEYFQSIMILVGLMRKAEETKVG